MAGNYVFKKSDDLELIQQILVTPKCFHQMKSDLVPAIHQFRVEMPAAMTAVIIWRDAQPVGLFLLDNRVPAISRVHFCMLPVIWGKESVVAGKAAIRWIWDMTSIDILEAAVPSYNSLARKFALRMGFKQYGIDEPAGRKYGKPFSLILLRLERKHERS